MSAQSHQHAPSPDYQLHDDLQPVEITCRDCGDTEIQFVPFDEVVARINRQRCDECQEEQDSERAAKRAVSQAVVGRLLDMSVMRQPYEQSIHCDACGEEVGTFTGYVDHLDGKAGVCPHCGTVGKLSVGDDEGSAYIRFRAYTEQEIESQ